MQLSLQTFTTLMQNMAAAVEASATQLLDLTVGSTLRAVLEVQCVDRALDAVAYPAGAANDPSGYQ